MVSRGARRRQARAAQRFYLVERTRMEAFMITWQLCNYSASIRVISARCVRVVSWTCVAPLSATSKRHVFESSVAFSFFWRCGKPLVVLRMNIGRATFFRVARHSRLTTDSKVSK